MSDISTVAVRFTGADMEFVDKASGTVVFAFRQALGSLHVENATDAITAHSGGGQTSATKLTASLNRVTTVAAGNDSVLLPPAVVGLTITVTNATALNSMNVFPASATQGGITGGDAINALSANSAFAVAEGKTAQFCCAKTGQWHSILSA